MRLLPVTGAVLIAWISVSDAISTSFEDVARYLAGLEPTDQSALQALTHTPEWNDQARYLDASWAVFDRSHLSKVRRFVRGRPFHQRVAYYMFGGPDFAYITSFFPNAEIYVLSGLEPVSDLPDPLSLEPEDRARYLTRLRNSLKKFFDFGFFVTKDMHSKDNFSGVIPILYAMLARSGKQLRTVNLVYLSEDGALTVGGETRRGTPGIRITFADASHGEKELFYFNVDLSNRGIEKSSFLQFCERLAPGDSLIKNASYLLHRDEFSDVRNFILSHSVAVVQDDLGIPLRYFDPAGWRVSVFGHYRRPTGLFEDFYQPDLDALARRQHPKPIGFAIGYFWWIDGAGLQIASNKRH